MKKIAIVENIMWKLNLVLGDVDERYIEGLSKFIRSTYLNKFTVNEFTQKKSMDTYIDGNIGEINVLLITPEFISDEINMQKIGIIIILLESNKPEEINGFPCINKYQPGEVILNNILEIYSCSNPNVGSILNGSKETTLISVFSPMGGSGKTTISITLSALLAKVGLKVLFLNLETINSSPFFIKNSIHDKGLSNLLFYLKDKRKSLSTKIEALKYYDSDLGISYFSPADFSLEMDELTETDVSKLFFELKEIGQFDAIITDTDSVLNKRNLSVLNSSDFIIMPVIQNAMAKFKLDMFKKELRKISNLGERDIYNKIILVINRFCPELQDDSLYFDEEGISIRIPLINDKRFSYPDGQVSDIVGVMSVYIEGLVKLILEEKSMKRKGYSVL